MRRTNKLNPKFSGFTLIELLVVVAIIAVLVALLLPVMAKARSRAKQLLCSTHLRQLGTGVSLYANDNHGVLPPFFWDNGCRNEIVQKLGLPSQYAYGEILHCPSDQNPSHTDPNNWPYLVSYGGNNHLGLEAPGGRQILDNVVNPINIMVFTDITWCGGWNGINIWTTPDMQVAWLDFRHLKKINILFCDLHVGQQDSLLSYQQLWPQQ